MKFQKKENIILTLKITKQDTSKNFSPNILKSLKPSRTSEEFDRKFVEKRKEKNKK